MKKIVLIFCVFMLFISVAYAKDECFVSAVPEKFSVNSGDEINYIISVKNAEDIVKVQMTVNFDSDRLEYVSKKTIVENSALMWAKLIEDEKIGVVTTLKSPINGDCDLLSLRFKVKDGAQPGEIKFSITNSRAGKESDKETPLVTYKSGGTAKICYNYSVDKLKFENGELCMDINVLNKNDNAKLIICGYRNDRFVNCIEEDISQIIGKETVKKALTGGILPTDNIKVVIWDGYGKMFPLSEYAEMH